MIPAVSSGSGSMVHDKASGLKWELGMQGFGTGSSQRVRCRLHTGLTRSAEDSTAKTFARLFVVMVRIGDDSGDDDHDADGDEFQTAPGPATDTNATFMMMLMTIASEFSPWSIPS